MVVWNVICPVCGLKYKSTEMRERWDRIHVCEKDWEPRHPLDFYNVKAEDTSVPYVYPDTDGVEEDTSGWINTLTCTPSGSYATPGEAIPGCSIPGTGLSPL